MRPNCLMLSGFYCRGSSKGLFHAWLGNISAQWQPFTLPVTHTLADPNRGPVGEESFKRQCFLLLVSGGPTHVSDSLVGDRIWWVGNLGQLGSSMATLGVGPTTIEHLHFCIKYVNVWIPRLDWHRWVEKKIILWHLRQPFRQNEPVGYEWSLFFPK